MARNSKRNTIALWTLSGLLAVLFLMSGGSKLLGVEQNVQGFEHWGYPQWFRLVIGAVEVISAVMLLIPRAGFFGAGTLMAVMAGATYTHLFRANGEGTMAVATLILLGLATIVAWARRPASRSADSAKRSV